MNLRVCEDCLLRLLLFFNVVIDNNMTNVILMARALNVKGINAITFQQHYDNVISRARDIMEKIYANDVLVSAIAQL